MGDSSKEARSKDTDTEIDSSLIHRSSSLELEELELAFGMVVPRKEVEELEELEWLEFRVHLEDLSLR